MAKHPHTFVLHSVLYSRLIIIEKVQSDVSILKGCIDQIIINDSSLTTQNYKDEIVTLRVQPHAPQFG